MQAHELLARDLARRGPVSDRDRAALAALPSRPVRIGPATRLIEAGPAPDESCLLVRGMTMRQHRIPGRRPVVSAIQVTGEFLDLHAALLHHLDHDVTTIGPAEVEFVPAEALRALTESHPTLARHLWLATLIDAKIHRVWIAVRSALPAARRTGHFFCELRARISTGTGPAPEAFDVPFDQRTLAEILGYSAVHMNRAIRDLREEGLLTWQNGRIHLPDPDRLARICGFDPAYLELGDLPA
ncbi:Crp/Fnr family transcriptional regulator [Wenxinia saemankumensis]|uniref:cAMP-binding domain of CRP or a regulatory subunit of cAMP-dependent protein kinases n=1 Tax=Wenxinia saemankumensis TaxID=1447782 RepID=A0A1M6HUB0_9RHOB|nr:Crp/Fnr family transcriptional regulator [Wenxinia saemankumensis]SHJ25806.1 cAMP-binding domain of CRP or a regulatory subunit of cAMP-dependent protein kinases [Wenxinia saemankumensis]